jgi:hypothetical protein
MGRSPGDRLLYQLVKMAAKDEGFIFHIDTARSWDTFPQELRQWVC